MPSLISLASVAKRLYNALKLMPCRCQRRYTKTDKGFEITHRCERCAATEEYELLMIEEVKKDE